ncbi:MAG: Acidobacterial duplicated orphan permease (function unknown), partial [uncultured Solirubrobacterales bacterium]
AARGMRRARGFSVVVVLTLALGIAATTAMFSVVRGVLLRPLPFPDAERVVRLWPGNPEAVADRRVISAKELEDWERELRGFEAVGAFGVIPMGHVYGEGGAEPAYARTSYVSRGFFPTLGTPARLGRTLRAEEHVVGADRFAVVSDGFWRTQLGADPAVVGRHIRLDDKQFTVVGVMGPDFAFPDPGISVWIPSTVMDPDDAAWRGRERRWLSPVGRLRPGVTLEQGRAEIAALLERLAARYPQTNAGWTTIVVEDVRDSIVGTVRRGLLVLLGAVGLVLLVVCANVANLLLVRATGRGREMALRAALGAGRGRVVRLLLTESLLLALVGGALGVALAWWGVRTLVALSGHFLPRAADVRLDLGVLGFAVGVTLLTALVSGLWPALRASSARLVGALREGARGSSGGAAAHRARAALVGAEVALAVVLVAGAGLMLRSFERLTSVDPGFRPEGVLLARFHLEASGPPPWTFPEERRRVIERVRQIPGVTAAGATTFAPFTDGQGQARPFTVPGQPAPAPGEEPIVQLLPVSTGYFKALGVPLLAGEDVDAVAGDSTAGRSAIISKRMADRFWPGRNPVGESFLMGPRAVRVIGVAGDVRTTRLDSIAGYTAYVPDRQLPLVHVSLVVRTDGDPARLAGPVRAAIREVLPRRPILQIVPMQDKVAAGAATPRFFTTLVSVFGALALTLAAVGLYGIVAYVVRQREREIGVRVALGASPAHVVGLMLRRGMAPVLAGLAVGIPLALLATRLLRSLLYEVSASDPVTFVGVAALLAAVALVASWLPSRRAARVDPTVTLRAD